MKQDCVEKVEALQNHSPEAIIVDELSGEEEISACKKIRERGVQLIASTHGDTFENALTEPQLASVLGEAIPIDANDDGAKSHAGHSASGSRWVRCYT